MTFTQMRNHMMSHGTASSCAEAASSRAQSAQASFNTIMLILDAIIMASIIICALVLVLLVLAASAHTPLARITA
mgnify:CR=1 FL=1